MGGTLFCFCFFFEIIFFTSIQDDSPMHNIDIVGCCFGGRAGLLQRLAQVSVRRQAAAYPRKSSKGNDQSYLTSSVLPIVSNANVWIDYDYRGGGRRRKVSLDWPGGNWDLEHVRKIRKYTFFLNYKYLFLVL